ncbi:MAG: hypothetical protein SPI03_08105 [Campylobacter sputorum]|uniref:flagellar hook-length control protein FliK n=1 Tax=Campylobacter sputorum TaxID=206 RepID=UPI000B78CCC0|nr:flagellar hook-length control protein FliK [Campylobacter sputorum]ASM38128.1 hypothetical protein CSPARA_0534 [Campylobacter sputorum bv. paraureolyticus LMG 11764]MDY6121276.1 hypothetical protein [Campylobacter sputorum]
MESAINSNVNSGIGSEVLKNTQKPVQKNDSKTNSSVQNLLEKKDLFKKPDIVTNIAINEEKTSATLEKLVNKLLDAIKSNSNLLIKNTQITNSAKSLQVAPNLSKDLAQLTKVLDALSENLPELKELNTKLKEFLKPIENIKTTPLKTQIQKSGIMLEAAIKDALNKENIPKNITKLINEMKRVSSDTLIKEFTKLAQNETLNTKESFNELKKVLDEVNISAKKMIDNPQNKELKTITNIASKLENIVKFLNKINSKTILTQVVDEKANLIKNSAPQSNQNIVNNNANPLQNLKTNITPDKIIDENPTKQNTQKSPLEALMQNTPDTKQPPAQEKFLSQDNIKQFTRSINKVINDLKTELNTITMPKNEQIYQIQKEINTLINSIQNSLNTINSSGQAIIENFKQSIATDNLISKSENFTLQDKLSAAANKLNQISKLTNREFSDAKITFNETKSLLKTFNVAQKELENITPKNRAEAMSNLNDDMKNTLLKISKSTENSSLPNANQANNITNKLLAQIDIHQLASFATNSLQTYVPYVWDLVDGGNIAFKQGKKNKYYCKIDLNFKDYGSLNVMLALSKDRFLEISIAAQSENFKNLILENSKELKVAIINAGLNITNFTLKTMPKNSLLNAYEFSSMFDLGFDKRA